MIEYALLLGMLAAFNPCGAPLLPAYLGLFSMSSGDQPTIRRLHRGLLAGSTMSLGFVAVFVAVGLPLSALASVLSALAPGVIGVVGGGVVAIAILGLRGRAVSIPARWLQFRGGRGAIAMATFGALYAMGSLGCELPLFVALTGVATTRDWMTAVAAVLAFAVGMGLVVTVLSVAVSLAGPDRPRLRITSRWTRVIAAGVAIASGLYLVLVAVAEIWSPPVAASLGAPIAAGDRGLAAAFAAGPVLWAAALLVGIVVVVVTALLLDRFRSGARVRA